MRFREISRNENENEISTAAAGRESMPVGSRCDKVCPKAGSNEDDDQRAGRSRR